MSLLLYDPKVTPVKTMEHIASTIAHELAHQARRADHRSVLQNIPCMCESILI